MQTFIKHRTAIIGFALSCLLPLSHLAEAGEVKNVMKEIKTEYNAALGSSTLPDLAQHVAKLQDHVKTASQTRFPDDQATYNKGMQELQQGLEQVTTAIRANDMNKAKAALRQLNAIKKHYHGLLA